MSNQEDMITDEEYPIEKKRRLAKDISNMRNKIHLRKIKEIIFEENPDIAVNKDNRGMLMFFQNLSYATYVRLDKFLRKIEKDKLEKQTQSITETSEHLLLSSEADRTESNESVKDGKTVDYSKTRTRLRYSNKEKNLIKRQQYEKNINKKEEVLEESSQPPNTDSDHSNKKSGDSKDNKDNKDDVKDISKDVAKGSIKPKTTKDDKIEKTKRNTIFSKNTGITI